MTVATLTIEPDEFLGLSALAELDRAAGSSDDGSGPDALIEAKTRGQAPRRPGSDCSCSRRR